MAQPRNPVHSPRKPVVSGNPESKMIQPELLTAISQELRSQLNNILSLAEILDEGIYGPQMEQQHHALRSMIESGEQMAALINDAAIFSKISSGALDLQAAPVWVMALCQASIRLVRERSYHREIRLILQYDNLVDVMIGDEWVLRQILVNLLDTALKLTNEKGVVSLEVRGDPDQQQIHFSVECSGSMIAKANLAHLFEPFSRPNNSQTQSYGGAGLRLALVQRMVQLHRGSITARVDPGQALTFLMTLPWSKPPEKSKLS